jgi:myo-inositol-1(or 4)-monophosphatase
VGLKAWDGAAGLLIAQEAGARVSGLGGAEYRLGGEALIVSNGHLHDAITTIIGVGW